jgi:hypothetical protein
MRFCGCNPPDMRDDWCFVAVGLTPDKLIEKLNVF